jgi:dynein assembly factor 1
VCVVPSAQVLDVLVQLPRLSVLYLQGNGCVKRIPHYRKVVVARLPHLKYLDDRPVFDDERLRAEAWFEAFEAGGLPAAKEAEKLEIERQKKEKEERDLRNFLGE